MFPKKKTTQKQVLSGDSFRNKTGLQNLLFSLRLKKLANHAYEL